MYCYKCGAQCFENAVFCVRCGSKIVRPTAAQADSSPLQGAETKAEDDKTTILPRRQPIEEDDKTTILPRRQPVEEDDKTTILPRRQPVEEDDKTTILPRRQPAAEDDKTTILPRRQPIEEDDKTTILPKRVNPTMTDSAAAPTPQAETERRKEKKPESRQRSPVRSSKAPVVVIIAAVLLAVSGAVFCFFGPLRNSTEDILMRADSYCSEGNYSAADAEYEKAIIRDPLNENAYLRRAETLVKCDKHDEAVEVLSEGYQKTGSSKLWEYLQQLKQE